MSQDYSVQQTIILQAFFSLSLDLSIPESSRVSIGLPGGNPRFYVEH